MIYTLVRIQPGLDFVQSKYAGQLAQDETGQVRLNVEKQRATFGLARELTEEETQLILSGRGDEVHNDLPAIKGYWMWLQNAIQGDFGESFKLSVETGKSVELVDENGAVTVIPESSKDVIDVIRVKSGISFVIALIATVLQFLISIPLGIISATKQYGVVDYSVTVLAMMGISLPTFFLGALLLRLFAIQLGWFPYAGLVDANTTLSPFMDKVHHLVLPMTTLVILSIGGLMRYTRTNMLEVLNSDFIRTARAKGLSEHTVIYKHAFRNTLIPIVTMLAGILPSLFGGAMITETVFAIPGIGKAAYDAVIGGDIPFVMAYNLFISALSIIGTLLSDLMYAVVDPRVKLVG